MNFVPAFMAFTLMTVVFRCLWKVTGRDSLALEQDFDEGKEDLASQLVWMRMRQKQKDTDFGGCRERQGSD